MKLKKHWILYALAVLSLLTGTRLAAEESIYGHITFIDNGAAVVRADGGEVQALVNLPLAPGDMVITPDGGRCELQFDNGTVIRLDKNSRLRLATVLAPSLTSNWKITTLELEKGQLYTLPQTYGHEMFQVVTPNAAANLKSRVIAILRLDADGGTSFFSGGGRFQVLYGAKSRSLKKITVKADRPIAITADNAPAERVAKRDIEFMAWNEYVDRHFKELHYGISKVPPKLKFGNSALTYWAEKWSSLFGEWIYDEFLGYVWRPADDRFAYDERPFFHADFVRVNGQLYLVPQQQWGWVPAHMGTWVWMKRGWTWIPGDWFHPGIVEYQGGFTFPTLSYYMRLFRGYAPWNSNITQLQGPPPHESKQPVLPRPLVEIIKRVEKIPAGERQGIERAVPIIDGKKLPPAIAPALPMPVPGNSAALGPARAQKILDQTSKADGYREGRDWNPDSRWAARSGYSIRYSSSSNAVICPELKISSDNLHGVERMILRNAASGHYSGPSSGGANFGQQGNGSSGSASGTATSDQGHSDTGEKDDGKGK
jgi:hypothetical protein